MRGLGQYILDTDGETPIPCIGPLAWAQWYETAQRRVAWTDLPGGYWVSTVYLGLDHNFTFKGPPVLWETMVFRGRGNGQDQWRYTSLAAARRGHAAAVKYVLAKVRASSRRPARGETASSRRQRENLRRQLGRLSTRSTPPPSRRPRQPR